MTKRVDETPEGKSITAYVILNKKKEHVATVRARYASSGGVLVNVLHFRGDCGIQTGHAGGYGYDKFTAALVHMKIDGHEMTGHCGARKPRPKAGFWSPTARAPKGWRFANYSTEKGGYTDCYRDSGLDYLRAIGYTVIQAI